MGAVSGDFLGVIGVGSNHNERNKLAGGPCENPRSLSSPKGEKTDFFKYFWGFRGSFCTPILQDIICQKNLGITEYVHFQTNVNFSIYLSAMGFRKN